MNHIFNFIPMWLRKFRSATSELEVFTYTFFLWFSTSTKCGTTNQVKAMDREYYHAQMSLVLCWGWIIFSPFSTMIVADIESNVHMRSFCNLSVIPGAFYALYLWNMYSRCRGPTNDAPNGNGRYQGMQVKWEIISSFLGDGFVLIEDFSGTLGGEVACPLVGCSYKTS